MIDTTGTVFCSLVDFTVASDTPLLEFSDGTNTITTMLMTKDRIGLVQLADRDLKKIDTVDALLTAPGTEHTFDLYGYEAPMTEMVIYAVHLGAQESSTSTEESAT